MAQGIQSKVEQNLASSVTIGVRQATNKVKVVILV
jgi:hypothetical protein